MIFYLNKKNAGFGCNIGSYYFGALGYADDVVLLCPTREGLRKMIRICETYAAEHDFLFNGNKSKLLVCGTVTECLPKLYVNEIEVPVCNTALHLGNLVSNNVHDTIDYGITIFNYRFIILYHHLESVKAQSKISYLFNIALHFMVHKYGLYIRKI